MTTDSDEIVRWAEERGGRPARVRGTGDDGDVGMIRIEFPDRPQSRDENLEEITWEEWFQVFDESDLALVVQDELDSGEPSRFNKIVARAPQDQDGAPPRRRGGSTRAGAP
jgi:hypothetical protein